MSNEDRELSALAFIHHLGEILDERSADAIITAHTAVHDFLKNKTDSLAELRTENERLRSERNAWKQHADNHRHAFDRLNKEINDFKPPLNWDGVRDYIVELRAENEQLKAALALLHQISENMRPMPSGVDPTAEPLWELDVGTVYAVNQFLKGL